MEHGATAPTVPVLDFYPQGASLSLEPPYCAVDYSTVSKIPTPGTAWREARCETPTERSTESYVRDVADELSLCKYRDRNCFWH
jgi:hypothetical protein